MKSSVVVGYFVGATQQAVSVIYCGFTWQTLNIILLWSQSWEKTKDCRSAGQGLMTASFKVRTMPLAGNNGSFEEGINPDFSETAIGRFAPIDSCQCIFNYFYSIYVSLSYFAENNWNSLFGCYYIVRMLLSFV